MHKMFTLLNFKAIYSFNDNCGEACTKFDIDSDNGVIRAAQSGYDPSNDGVTINLNVRVIDGAPSALNPSGLPNERKFNKKLPQYAG